MICVTGASGTVGREVVKQLQAMNAPFRAAVSSASSAEAARARGIDVVICDYHQPDTVRAALHGCDALFLLGPNLIEQTAARNRMSWTRQRPLASVTSSSSR